MRYFLPLLALLLLAGGCASVPKYQPEVSLTNLRLGDPTLFETPAVFTVRIDNDTPTPLSLIGGTYRVSINGHTLGKGLSHNVLDLPGLSSATDEVTVHLGNLGMATQIKGILQSEKVSYKLETTLYLKDGSGSTSVKTVREGVLNFRDFMPDQPPRSTAPTLPATAPAPAPAPAPTPVTPPATGGTVTW